MSANRKWMSYLRWFRPGRNKRIPKWTQPSKPWRTSKRSDAQLPLGLVARICLPEFAGAEAKVAVENHLYNRATRQHRLRAFVVQDGGETHADSGPGPDA